MILGKSGLGNRDEVGSGVECSPLSPPILL